MSDHDSLPSVIPYLTVRNAAAAVEFYKKAFGARAFFLMTFPGTDKVLHAQLGIGNSQIMVTEEMPELNPNSKGPEMLGGSPVTIHLYFDDVDQLFQQAIDAGATVTMELMNAFWGDRCGRLRDPFGHEWSLGQPIEEVSPEEMEKRARKLFRKD
ncbi:MAG: hypothetical protein CMJ46_15120 [Planctomyces sp.]|nr:hypothetical protein [Planctomyces sp.]